MAKKAKKEEISCKTVDEALAFIKKRFGKDSVRRLSDNTTDHNIKVISTGSLWFDAATGIGGLPRGRVIEIKGPEGSGKTSLALHTIAEVNKLGESALFIDVEHALDPSLATNIGVDPDLFALSQPYCAEEALDMIHDGVISGKFGVIVLDSVAALSPRAEIEGEMGDSQVGLQARLMGKALRKLTGIVSKTNTLVIFINQIRQKIGIMFGNPETTSGGNALKFFASMRVDIRAGDKIKSGENIVGNQVTIKIIKNKLAIPYKIIKTDFIYGHGFNKEKELLEAGEEREIVVRKGPKYYFNKILLGNKKDEAYEALRSDPVLFNEIFSEVKKIGEVKKHEAYVGKEDEE